MVVNYLPVCYVCMCAFCVLHSNPYCKCIYTNQREQPWFSYTLSKIVFFLPLSFVHFKCVPVSVRFVGFHAPYSADTHSYSVWCSIFGLPFFLLHQFKGTRARLHAQKYTFIFCVLFALTFNAMMLLFWCSTLIDLIVTLMPFCFVD